MNAEEIQTLDSVRSKIESMSKERHMQALNILVKYPTVTVNEPKYGNVNINLSRIPKEAIDDLLKFISYVEDQESSLQLAEEQKKKYQSDFFTEGGIVSNAQ
jgi:DNA polymerase IIIc chi subunit